MSDNYLLAGLSHYGVSPWEIEVIYGLLSERFKVRQNDIEEQDPDFVSTVNIIIPLAFNEEFFKWFEYKRWDKMKYICKEMKRRRGRKNSLKINVGFLGTPKIEFSLDVEEKDTFDNALEKLDFVVELLSYHLNFENIDDVSQVIYKFDIETRKWKMHTLFANNKKFVLTNNTWKMII
ncbi:MAG: hypothetical protein EB150_00075 [Nitrososphaeria archaeon]|nr:hypothetical protein [Nitrosopumilaceae archaeon]NDB87735.1 hypothetical protein [Nitrososphaerota archaeon]NDF28604.1 hypothetical protein [Nitrososphaeria archaeon]NDB62382.1 hypothetical protein [Nitrosopumilaceae archaeon]NDB89651.1 hypothetical protein [Nitrososphaerota archaeon]